MNVVAEATPAIDNSVVIKRNSITNVRRVQTEDSLVIARYLPSFVKICSEASEKSFAILYLSADSKVWKRGEALSKCFIENKPYCYRIICKFCGAK
jgi:hypothetical protein